MKKEFTKKDLMSGDIVVCRDGMVGIVILDADVIVYKETGYSDLSDYNENLEHDYEDEATITKVYRGEPMFLDNYNEDELVFSKEYPKLEKAQMLKPEKEIKKEPKDLLTIVTQAFYGNRVSTRIERSRLDAFILGHLDGDIFEDEKTDKEVIKVPNTDHLVIVYNKQREEQDLIKKDYLLENENYELKPLAIIPEMNLKIYSRCIVCRINENGEFESLQNEDYEKFMNYLAK